MSLSGKLGLTCVSIIMAALSAAVCHAAPPEYAPDPAAQAKVSPEAALGFLHDFAGAASKCGHVADLHVADEKLVIVCGDGSGAFRLPLARLFLRLDNAPGGGEVVVNGYALSGFDGAYARRLAEALFALKQATLGGFDFHAAEKAAAKAKTAKEEAEFAALADGYRRAAVKPDLPEETRRFKVQAEDAVARKRFLDAAGLFEKALALSPWWPEGRYNRALVLGETGQYASAIAEMKRYLMLVPDSAGARSGQDKIYVWEGRMR